MTIRLTDAELQALLAQDVPCGDLTTDALGIGARPGRIAFRSRRPIVLCASEEAARLLELAGARVAALLPSGTRIAPADLALAADGPAGALHRAWKVAQTLMEYASGIATATAAIVDALRAAGFDTPVACTRKNFPGTKAIAVKAVAAGGGVMHRLGLSETLLLFPEHRAFIAGHEWEAALRRLRARCPERKLVAEAGSADEALRLAALGADVLQLEKFAPEEFAACVQALRAAGRAIPVAPAGGVNAGNAAAYARAGAAFLVTSAPYFAGPVDIAVALAPA